MNEDRLQILIVRHAHAEWVPDETRPLSAQGARDARVVARLLAPFQIDAIYSSPYPRAVQTVEPLSQASGLAIEIVDGLRERTLADGAVPDFEAALQASWEDFECSFPGGESSRTALDRFSLAIDDVVSRHESGTIVVATHGNVLGLWLHQWDPAYGYEFWRSLSWPDIFRLSMGSGRIVEIERLWRDRPE